MNAALSASAITARSPLQTRTDEPLLWLVGGDHETQKSESYYYDARRRLDRPHLTIQLTLGGNGFYAARGTRTILPAGSAWIDTIPGEFEYGFHRGDKPYSFVFISIGGPEAGKWARRLIGDFGHVISLDAQSAVETHMLNIAHAHRTATLHDRYLTSGQLYLLLMTLYSTLRGTRVSTSPRIARAMKLIDIHGVESSFNIDTLAERLDCSREYLSRRFREAAGVTPSEYLAQYRLRRAAKLLRDTDDKLDAIAHRCGLSGANYFCRLFRKHTGVTPAQFRARPWMVV